MLLRLYKNAYADPLQPGLVRFLFESTVHPIDKATSDFYLYVWIRDGVEFDSFQAVLDDTWVLTYRNDSLTFGAVKSVPFNRSVRTATQHTKRKRIERLLETTMADMLTSLVTRAAALSAGKSVELALDKNEIDLIRGISAGTAQG